MWNDDIPWEYILNVFDRIIELNNSIVFTTNTSETIDPALIRLGCIANVIKMDYVNGAMLEEILEYIYVYQYQILGFILRSMCVVKSIDWTISNFRIVLSKFSAWSKFLNK